MLSFANRALLVGLFLTYFSSPTWAIFFAVTTCNTVCHSTLRVDSRDTQVSSHLYFALSSFDHTMTSVVIKDADGVEKEVSVNRQYGMHVLSLEGIDLAVSIHINTPVVLPTSNILTGVVCLQDVSSDQVVCEFLPVVELPTLPYHAYVSNRSSLSQSNAELSLHIALPFSLPDETTDAEYSLTIANNDIFTILAEEFQCSTSATSSGAPALSCPFHAMIPFRPHTQTNSLSKMASLKTTNTAFPYELYLPLHSYSHYRASRAPSMPLLELTLPVTDASPLQTLLEAILVEAHATVDATNPTRFLLSPRLPSSPPSTLPPLPPAATTTMPITMQPDVIDWRATSLPALDVFVRGLFGIEAEDVVYESISRPMTSVKSEMDNVRIQNIARRTSTQRLNTQRSDTQRLSTKQRAYVTQRMPSKQRSASSHLSSTSNAITRSLRPTSGGLLWPGVAVGALPSVVLVAGEQGFRARDHLQLLLSVSVESSDTFLSPYASCVPSPPNTATCTVTATVPLNEEELSVFAVYSAVFERDEEVYVEITHSIPSPINTLSTSAIASMRMATTSVLYLSSYSSATISTPTGSSAVNTLALTPVAASKVTLTPSFEAFAGVSLSLISGGASFDPATGQVVINPYSQGSLYTFASTTTSLLDNQLIQVEVGCLLETATGLSANDGPCIQIAKRVYSCSFNYYFSDTLYNLPYSFYVSPFISHEDINYRRSPALIKRVLRSNPSIVLEQFDANVHGSDYFYFETRNDSIHVGVRNITLNSHLHVVGTAPRLFYPSVDRLVINTTIPVFLNAIHDEITVMGTFTPLIPQTSSENERFSEEDAWIPDSAPEAHIPLDCYGFAPKTLVCILTAESHAQHGQVSITVTHSHAIKDVPAALPLSIGIYTGVTVAECGGYSPLTRAAATDTAIGTADVLENPAPSVSLPTSSPTSTAPAAMPTSTPYATRPSDITAARAHVRRLARDSVAHQQRSAASMLSDQDPVLPSDWVEAYSVSADAIPVIFLDPRGSTNGGGNWATQASVVWVWPALGVLLLVAGIYALYRRRVMSTACVRVVDAAKCGLEMGEIRTNMNSSAMPSITNGLGVTVIEMGAVTRTNSSATGRSHPSVDRADVSRSLASITAVTVAVEAVAPSESGQIGERSRSQLSGVCVPAALAEVDTLEADTPTRSVALTEDPHLSSSLATAPSVFGSSIATSMMEVESVQTVIQPFRVPSGLDSITPLPSDGVRVSARTATHSSTCLSPISISEQSRAVLPRVAEVVKKEPQTMVAVSAISDILTTDGLPSPYHALAPNNPQQPSANAASVYEDHVPVVHARLHAPAAVVAAQTPWTYARSLASCPGGNNVGLETSSLCSSDALSHYAFSTTSSMPSTAFPEQSPYTTMPNAYYNYPTHTPLALPAAATAATATTAAAAMGVAPAAANAVNATAYVEAHSAASVITEEALLLRPGATGEKVMDEAFLDVLLMNMFAMDTEMVSTLPLDAETVETVAVLAPPPLSSAAPVLQSTSFSSTHTSGSLEEPPLAATSLLTMATTPFMLAAPPIMAGKHFPPPVVAAPVPADDYAEPIAVPGALPLSVPTAFASHSAETMRDYPETLYTPYASLGLPLFSPQSSLGSHMAPLLSSHVDTTRIAATRATDGHVDAWTPGLHTYSDSNVDIAHATRTSGNGVYSGGDCRDVPRDQAPVPPRCSIGGADAAATANIALFPLDTSSSQDASSGRSTVALEPYTLSLSPPAESTSAPPSQRVNISLDGHTTATSSTTSPSASQRTASSNNTVLMPQSPLVHIVASHEKFSRQDFIAHASLVNHKKSENFGSLGRNECFRLSPSSSDCESLQCERSHIVPALGFSVASFMINSSSSTNTTVSTTIPDIAPAIATASGTAPTDAPFTSTPTPLHVVAQPFTVMDAVPATDVVTPLYSTTLHVAHNHAYPDESPYDPRRLVDYKNLLAPALLPPPVPKRIYVTQAPPPMLVLPPAPYQISDMVYHPMAPHRMVLLHNVAVRVLPHVAPYKYPIYPRTPRPVKAVFALCPEPPLPVVTSQNPDAIVPAEPYVWIIDGDDVIPSPPPSLLDSLSGVLSYRSMKSSFAGISDASLRSEIRQVMGQDFMRGCSNEHEVQRPPMFCHNPSHAPPEACVQRIPVKPLEPEVLCTGYRQRNGAFPSPPPGIDLEQTNPVEHARYAEWLGISGYELYGCQPQLPPNTDAVRVVPSQQPLDEIN